MPCCSLKIVSKTLLVDLPEGHSFTVEDFVKIQEKHITAQSLLLQVSQHRSPLHGCTVRAGSTELWRMVLCVVH